jgi:hypothetical protein
MWRSASMTSPGRTRFGQCATHAKHRAQDQIAGSERTSSRRPSRTLAITCRTLKPGSRASTGHELVHVLHWMQTEIDPPPEVPATSFQNIGLSGVTRAGTITAASLRVRIDLKEVIT